MANQKLSLALSKVMIAAAWADGEVQPEEINCLKEFTLQLPEMDDQAWEHLDVYISMPIEEDERLQLLDDLKAEIRSDEDKQLVLHALEMVFMADGIISQEETHTIEQIKRVLGLAGEN